MTGSRVDRALSLAARVLAVLIALVATAQAALAGRFISGDFDALEIHTEVASILGALVAGMAVIAAIRFARRRALAADLALAAVLLVGTGAQAAVAHMNLLAVHVPLGVAVITLAYVQAGRTCRSRSASAPVESGHSS